MDIITNLSSNSKNTRLPYIDNIKGFGMILVVLGHVINAYSTEESYNSNLFMDFVSIFYMKMFFFFSGFVYLFNNCSLHLISKLSSRGDKETSSPYLLSRQYLIISSAS